MDQGGASPFSIRSPYAQQDKRRAGFDSEDLHCSTIVQPVEQIARTAVDLLLNSDRASLPALVCLPVSYRPGGTTKDDG